MKRNAFGGGIEAGNASNRLLQSKPVMRTRSADQGAIDIEKDKRRGQILE